MKREASVWRDGDDGAGRRWRLTSACAVLVEFQGFFPIGGHKTADAATWMSEVQEDEYGGVLQDIAVAVAVVESIDAYDSQWPFDV